MLRALRQLQADKVLQWVLDEQERAAAEQVLNTQPSDMDTVLQMQLKIGKYKQIGALRAWLNVAIAELDRNIKQER